MGKVQIIQEEKPINVSHDTYRRECRYTLGIHIPENEFLEILEAMSRETKLYFEFHNPGKVIRQGIYLNGHAGLAQTIVNYYQNNHKVCVDNFIYGKDFYVKII